MPRKKQESNLTTGYSNWSKRKLINEAINVARWNPWLAHNWMSEATDGLSIENFDLIDYHDAAADRINDYWNKISRMVYYDAKSFWNNLPPKMIKKIVSDDEYNIIQNEEE